MNRKCCLCKRDTGDYTYITVDIDGESKYTCLPCARKAVKEVIKPEVRPKQCSLCKQKYLGDIYSIPNSEKDECGFGERLVCKPCIIKAVNNAAKKGYTPETLKNMIEINNKLAWKLCDALELTKQLGEMK